MRSHLLVGKVRHCRSTPVHYELEHDVWYFALDLDELDEVPRKTALVRRNRRAPVSFRDADHLPEPAADLRSDLLAHLRRSGFDPDGWRVTLITNLRLVGYVFNPASFYLCRDASGALRVVVVEVHNTYGERHLYTLEPSRSGPPFSAQMAKEFHVSPFIGSNGDYRLTVRDERRGLSIGIAERDGGKPLLATSLVLRRLPLTTRNLARLLLRYPLVTHKTIAAIHWHALRLWLRGVPFNRHVSVVRRPATIAADGAGR